MRANDDVEKCELMFATGFLLGASARLSSLGTQRTWSPTPVDIAGDANLLI